MIILVTLVNLNNKGVYHLGYCKVLGRSRGSMLVSYFHLLAKVNRLLEQIKYFISHYNIDEIALRVLSHI